jgi:hypothetical protein
MLSSKMPNAPQIVRYKPILRRRRIGTLIMLNKGWEIRLHEVPTECELAGVRVYRPL